VLHIDGEIHRIHDARKFSQHAIAHELDDAPVVLGDLGIDQIGTQGLIVTSSAADFSLASTDSHALLSFASFFSSAALIFSAFAIELSLIFHN
jgi:hypothetical protein